MIALGTFDLAPSYSLQSLIKKVCYSFKSSVVDKVFTGSLFLSLSFSWRSLSIPLRNDCSDWSSWAWCKLDANDVQKNLNRFSETRLDHSRLIFKTKSAAISVSYILGSTVPGAGFQIRPFLILIRTAKLSPGLYNRLIGGLLHILFRRIIWSWCLKSFNSDI